MIFVQNLDFFATNELFVWIGLVRGLGFAQ